MFIMSMVIILFFLSGSIEAGLNGGLSSSSQQAGIASIVMDADTGEILALENPGLAIQSSFPPGSLIKVFSALYGIKNGILPIGERVDCPGFIQVGDNRFDCWDTSGHGRVNLFKALAYSCNVYFYRYSDRYEASEYFQFLRQFGFGEVTGIQWPNEEPGVLPEVVHAVEKARVVVGVSREVQVTPIQVITAFSAVVNGGKLLVPFYPVASGRQPRGEGKLQEGGMVRRDLHIASYLPLVQRGMTEGATYGTTAGYFQASGGYAKTGTAPWVEGYHTHGWFVGYLPVQGRRLVILVFFLEGTGYKDAFPAGLKLAQQWKEHLEDSQPVIVWLFSLVKPKIVNIQGRFGHLIIEKEEGEVKARGLQVGFIEDGQLRVVIDGEETMWPGGQCVKVKMEQAEGWLNVAVPGVESRDYNGSLLIAATGNYLEIYNRVKLGDYLQGVIGSEMGEWLEALKAQAIVSRTYALKNLKRHTGFDFCDTTHCQHYTGRMNHSPLVKEGVVSTGGLVITYKGALCDVFFHSTCGGQTIDYAGVWEDKTLPYLLSVDDQERCAVSPHYRWTYEIEEGRLLELLERISGYRVQGLEVLKMGKGGWVKQLLIRGRKGERRVIRGEEFHIFMGRELGWGVFKSAHFSLSMREKSGGKYWYFSGKGLGHGVGMCQWGARRMAEMGEKYPKILGTYFPGIDIGYAQ